MIRIGKFAGAYSSVTDGVAKDVSRRQPQPSSSLILLARRRKRLRHVPEISECRPVVE